MFKTKQISSHIISIQGILHERMYLVMGQAAAALIDCGSGFGSLSALVRQMTDKPVLVLLTHGHVDHAMGAKEFSLVYMNRSDIPVFLRHGTPEFRWGVAHSMAAGKTLKESDYTQTDDPSRFLDLKDGDIFDLGGVHLDIFSCAGHTPGSVTVLVREERTLIVGDACSNFTFLAGEESLPVALYEKNLRAMKRKTDGKYGRVLEAHGTGELPPDVVEGVLRVCNEIQCGRTDDVPDWFAGHRGVLAKMRVPHSTARADGKSGNIFYRKGMTGNGE